MNAGRASSLSFSVPFFLQLCGYIMFGDDNTQPRKDIVVLGGSYGGLSTSHYLLKHVIPELGEKSVYRVTIVSSAPQAMCRPACPRALLSDAMFPQDKLFVDIAKSFEQYPAGSIRFLQGTATTLDHHGRSVLITLANGSTETISFWSLVVATGASTPSPLLGLNRDMEHLQAEWKAFRAALPTARSIVIAGGGPAGVETAGELGHFLNGRSGWFSAPPKNPKVSITIVTSGSKILPLLRPAIAKKAESYLAQVGVTILRNTKVKTVDPPAAGTGDVASKATIYLEDDKPLEADLYIPATGTRPNTDFVDPTLLTADGRIETNPLTLRVDKAGPRIYAIGDAASTARPAIHLIFGAVPVLCANMQRDFLLASGTDEGSAGEDRLFEVDASETQLVPIGKDKGVGAAKGYQLPSFLVWLIKGRDYWLWTVGNLWSGKQWAKRS